MSFVDDSILNQGNGMASHSVSFANFICKFGEQLVLLDLADEIVLPAFFDATLRRTYADQKYFFKDVKIIDLNPNGTEELGVIGRLVNDTVMRREQVLVDGQLVKDPASMPSAPSSIFVLILSNHKLLYLQETNNAPSLGSFKSTIEAFIKAKHKAYVIDLHEKAKETGEKTTFAQLYEQTPRPIINVVPLSSEVSISEFIKRFSVLKRISVELIEPNDEPDTERMIKEMRDQKHAVGAKDAKIVYTNDKGLSQENVTKELKKITDGGNAHVTLSGKDQEGDNLSGSNENFKISVPCKEIASDIQKAARDLYLSFVDKVNAKIVVIGQVTNAARAKLGIVSERIKKG